MKLVRSQEARVHIVDQAKVWAMKDSGMTNPEIAEELCISRSTVIRALRHRKAERQSA